MIKTIKLNKNQSITLSNNVGWTMEYLDQFGHDIIPDIMPALSAITNLVAGMAQAAAENGDTLRFEDAVGILSKVSGNTLTDAFIDLAGLRFVDLVNIVWSMAKAADEDIPEPKIWVRQFDNFPLDVIMPEVFDLVLSGMASSKNVKRLRGMIKGPKPSE